LINLKVLPPPLGLSDMMAGFTKLPTALLQITPNTSLDFISQDFIPLGTDYKVIKPDPSLKFITVND